MKQKCSHCRDGIVGDGSIHSCDSCKIGSLRELTDYLIETRRFAIGFIALTGLLPVAAMMSEGLPWWQYVLVFCLPLVPLCAALFVHRLYRKVLFRAKGIEERLQNSVE